MTLDVRPALPEPERSVLLRAIAAAGVSLDGIPAGYASPWLRTAAREAVGEMDEYEPHAASYARSPRSTRGATRA